MHSGVVAGFDVVVAIKINKQYIYHFFVVVVTTING